MTSESSQSSSPSPSLGDTFVGSFISLVSNSEIRYEGILYHINVNDSTLGLKNVRSCGTEGRKKDGTQVPPSDTVYDYILFRGSDIKDLQVNPTSSPLPRQEIQREQDVNQTSHARPAMSSPPSGYGMGRGGQWVNTPALSSKPVPATQHSSVPLGFQPPPSDAGSLKESPASLIGSTNSFQAVQSKPVPASQYSTVPLGFQPPPSNAGSLTESQESLIGSGNSFQGAQSNAGLSMPMPSFVQGNKLPSTGVPPGMMHREVSSSSAKLSDPQIIDMSASPVMGLVDDTSQVVTLTPDVASDQAYSSNPSPLGQTQRHTPPGLASSPSNLSTLSEAQLPASYIQNSYPVAPQAVGNGVYDSLSNHHNRSIPYSIPAMTSHSAPLVPGPFSNSPQSFSDMKPLLQSRQQMVNRGQEMFGGTNPVSMGVPSRSLATTYQTPLVPLAATAHQSRIPGSSNEFTEEFDFEAMNEKFNKTELWGFLGKNSQISHREETVVEPSGEGKRAYNKDDFFDTISCNPLDRVARSGQQQLDSRFPEHMRQNPEAYGNHFQMPLQPQPGQGAYLAAQTNYRGGYDNNNYNNYYSNSGYGYYSGGRGRGRNTPF
ncbi:Decapping 5-like protein [Hirschfeldia incana]|nr:Decapping 5-like protein [Hirschfeldia incana]